MKIELKRNKTWIMAICLKCYKRWIAVRPDKTKLVDMECSECGQGYVIETGEYIKE